MIHDISYQVIQIIWMENWLLNSTDILVWKDVFVNFTNTLAWNDIIFFYKYQFDIDKN
jgi:hypothetical protein